MLDWQKLTSFENLLLAFGKARQRKRARPDVQRFEFDLERELLDLQDELRSKSYRPGEFREFILYERKPRSICVAPFRDRVVHHALMNQLEPVLEGALAPYTYACRKGRGVHRAVRHYQHSAKRYPYVLKLDIASYFACIDHGILQGLLADLIEDDSSLWLCNRLIVNSPEPAYAPLWPGADLVDAMERVCGLPVGNLTSQHFANLYLNPVDQWLQCDSRVPRWLRYVDDLLIFGDDKTVLWAVLDELRERLAALRLSVHAHKCELYRCVDGVDVLGYRVTPNRVRLRRDNGYRFRRKFKKMARQYSEGRIENEAIRASVAAWLGHTNQADALGLQQAVLNEVVFQRGRSS